MVYDAYDLSLEFAFERTIQLEEVLGACYQLVVAGTKRKKHTSKQVCDDSSLGSQLVCVSALAENLEILDLRI
jgi:hypothetical protein